ncbi:MAG TPA: hypothetical protein VLQ76_01235 [Bacteroidales bacterium]|nr:hypothetical protein [Bacteroidales bacterium]
MKRTISLILALLFAASLLQAQTPETLTNSSVIKMSKANLSEELITDMIKSSPVQFDLSDSGLKGLESANVSLVVIEAMKTAAGIRGQTVVKEVTYVAPVSKPAETNPEQTFEALNYVAPLTELIKFNENQLRSFETVIAEWNKQVLAYMADIEKVNGQIQQVETELSEKKNADTKAYSADIMALQKKLGLYRGTYSQSRETMMKGGEKIAGNLEEIRNESLRVLGKRYGEIGQQVSSSNTDLSAGENTVSVNYTKRPVNEPVVRYINPATEMLAWYQNEIDVLSVIIRDWNPRVTKLIQEDSILLKQLAPIEAKLEELKANTKLNKTEIATLKKQVSEIEKNRKQLAQQMKDDSKELATVLKQVNQSNQDSLKQRFTDIIENITYAFQEKLSL